MNKLFTIIVFVFTSIIANAQIPATGNVLWLKADAAVYTDVAATTLATNGQTAAQWNDQSGNLAHAICSPLASRPTFVTNVINGKPVLRFTNHYLQTPNIDLSATDKTDMYIVYKSVSPNTNWEIVAEHGADYNTIVGFNLLENTQGQTYGGMFVGMSGGGYNHKDYPFKANEFKIVNTSFDKAAAANAKVNLRINAKDIVLYDQPSAASSGNFANNPLYIGNRGNAVGTYPLSGDIAEIILYNRKLTPVEKLTIEAYLNSKYNISCNVNTPLPGSGNCLQMGNYGAYVQDDADIDFGINDFTVEFWTMKRALTSTVYNSQCVNKWNSGNVPGSNEWAVATSSDGFNNIPSFNIETGTTIYKADATTSLSINKWYHLAAVREGNNLKIYVNGILEGTTAIPPGTSVNNIAERTFMSMGYIAASPYYSNNSNLDELRIWNSALSQSTIRDWMCKKETASHPNHASLTRYYKFDETSGTIFGNQIINCVTEAYSSGGILTTSGAPIGDNSAYDYAANIGTANLNFGSPSDNFTATMNAGTSDGVQVYGVNELPNNQNFPGIVGNNKYAGVFVINGDGTAAYNTTYNYTNNSAVTPANEPTLKLYKRTDNASMVWSAASNQTLNTGTKTITVTGQNTEYVLASAVTPIPPNCALNLSGVAGESVQVPSSTAMDVTTAYTCEAWFKTSSTNIADYRAIITRDPNAYTPTIYIAAGYDPNGGAGKIFLECAVGGVNRLLYGTTAVNDNQWHHVAASYDGENIRLYVDGVLENTLAATGTLPIVTSPLGIGYNYADGRYQFIGKIDEVRIWNVARNLTQITATMNNSLAGNETGLAAYYNFNSGIYNGSGIIVPNNCTNTGAVLNGFTTGTSSTNPTFDCPNTALPTFAAPTCAAKFNGTNSRVDIGSLGAMPNKGTIEFWMNQPSFSNYQMPVTTIPINTTITDGIFFQTYASGQLIVNFGNAANNQVYASFGNLTANRNYHIAVTWDLTSLTYKGYLDGRLIFTSPLTYYPTTLPRLTLGAGYNDGRYYNGTLDEVRYWNVERTQAQLISKASDSLVGNEAGLQAYYRFNDNSINGAGQTITNYATATGATLNGTTVNYVKFPCTVNPPTCGITFSGAAGEGVQVPHNAAFNSTTNITYEAWVKQGTDVAVYRRIVGKGGNGTQEAPGIYVQQTTGKVSAGILINGIQQIVTSSLAINDNEWHHTAFTYDGTTLKLYIDGSLDGTLTAAGTITTNSSPLDIGYNSPLNLYPFIGKIDEVRVWNTTRTLSEIQTAMNGTLLGNESGLVAYYHFNDNSRSGQNRTVTNFCTTTGSVLNGTTFGNTLTPVFECAPPPFTNPECNMVLNGTTDYATAPGSVILNLNQFSLGAYVKTTDASGNYKNIVWKDVDGSNANYALYITNTNKAQITFQRNPISGIAPNATGTTTITDGNWHYLVGTYDGANLKIYVDGVLEATTADASPVMTGANPLYLGTSAGFNKYNGSMDEISVWNTALAPAQITSLIGQQLAGNEANLVAYYNFDGITKSGQAQTIPNLCTATGAALNATTVGSISTPLFTCSEIPVNDPACAILLNGYADAVKATNGTNEVTYPTISQNFTMEIVAKPLLEKRGSGTGQYPIWPAGHYIENGQVGQAFVIAPDAGSVFGAGHAGVGISLGTNGIGVYEGANGYLQAPAVYNAPVADWVHITVVSENNKLKLYVNGALKHSAAASGFILHPSIGLGGLVTALTPNYAGYVSEVRVWNAALSADQIRNNINANLTGAEANLLSLYKLGTNANNGNNQIISGLGSMAGSIEYKTVGSNYTPLFTCANTTSVPKDTLPGSGKMLSFSGNNLYSAFNSSAFAELGNWGNAPSQGSIALWFNATTIKNNAVLFTTTHFRNHAGKNKGFNVFIKNNKLLLTIGTDTTVSGYQDTVTVLNTVDAARWYHIALNWDAGANSYAVYINGLSVATGTTSFLPTKFESVKAGAGIVPGYAYAWDGYIDEISEWNKILSPTEIKQQMCSKINAAQPNYTNVLHYYRFDNTTSSNNLISDYVGTAHGVYILSFLYDYTIYGNGGLFFREYIPAHYATDLSTSSAPIGAYSSYQYAGNTSTTALPIGNGQGGTDNVTATINTGTADGIHVYGEDMWPNTFSGINDTLPGSKRYAGVFMVNPNAAAYTFLYDYTNNPFVTPLNEPYIQIRKRQNNAATLWLTPTPVTHDQALNTLTCTGESTEYILAKGVFALPLKWISFTAQLNANKQSVLNWKVNNETNVKNYVVEWSTDGRNYQQIAIVLFQASAAGNYNLLHMQPVPGNNNYRVKQVDNDGRFSYTHIQLVKLSDIIGITVYPNPATDMVYIAGFNFIEHLELYDVSGRLMIKHQKAQSYINTSALARGVYVLKALLKNGANFEQKIILH
ncbi:MAG: LamG-like jellyroll fold domain-containing protein [Ferruginibacter sp.]